MSAMKVFKKGDALYREGEKSGTVYLIQSGQVSLVLKRQKASIELSILGSQQIIGEHAMVGALTHPHTALALTETKVIEISSDALKTQIEAASPILKTMGKSVFDKLKVVMRDLQSMKLERDPTPCPPEQTAKIFATLFHVSRIKGEVQTDGTCKVPWPIVKQYAQKVFLESPKRLEQALMIAVKNDCARIVMTKDEENPTAPEEIGFVIYNDLNAIEQFFEFYQYYHFKSGKGELLKVDERMMTLVHALLEFGAKEKRDRHGAVRLDYAKLIEWLKAEWMIQLNADHFAVLEQKGLFVKRQSTEQGVWLEFEFAEFERSLRNWKFLREVDRWNQKGQVDMNEPVFDAKKAAKSQGPACPECQVAYQGHPKFCVECGAKFTHAA